MFIRILLLLAVTAGVARGQDSIPLFTKGNIAQKVFEVEEILIRPTCCCIGECTCPSTAVDNSMTNRFSSADALLQKNGRITLMRRGNFALEPVLNGMASDRLNITIDGMRVFGACTDKMDPVTSYVEPNNMKAVSVQHGSAGSMFGSSLGGSVNMETNGATINPKKPLSGEVGAGFQSAALGFSGLFSINLSQKRWAVMANAVYRKFQNYRAGGGETVDFSQFEKWNGGISVKYMPTDRDILRADVIIDEAYNVGYPALPMDVLWAKARIIGLTYQHYPSNGALSRLEAKIYGNVVMHTMDDTHRPNVIMHMDMPGSTKTFGGHVDSRLVFGKHILIARMDGFHSNARAEMTMYPENDAPMFMLTWPDVNKLSLGLFIQDNIRFNANRTLSFNVRLEYINTVVTDEFGVRQASVFGQDVSIPDHRWLKNASMSYQEKLSVGPTVYFTLGYAERAPSVTEQYGFYIFNAHDGFDHVGNRDVLTEKAVQLDGGLRWERDKLSLNIAGFYYHLMDYILASVDSSYDAMTIGANGVKVAQNIKSNLMAGGNVQISYLPIKILELSTTVNYTFGGTYDGTPLPLIPPLRNLTTIKWSFERGFVQVECESAASQQLINPAFGERPTPAYSTLHLRAGYSFQFGRYGITVNAGIENLLDAHYRSHLDWGSIPRPGINGFTNVSITF
jgi:iron complex outermembrane receptor protein